MAAVTLPPLPPLPPIEPCPECPPATAGNCEILGLYWYSPGNSESSWSYAKAVRSGADYEYTWESRHEASELTNIWYADKGEVCDLDLPLVFHAVLRGYCEAMGAIEWVATWANTSENPGWTPDLILTPEGTAVVMLDGADTFVEDGGAFALSAIVNGETYGPVTFTMSDCG